jgi:hypothetical protein
MSASVRGSNAWSRASITTASRLADALVQIRFTAPAEVVCWKGRRRDRRVRVRIGYPRSIYDALHHAGRRWHVSARKRYRGPSPDDPFGIRRDPLPPAEPVGLRLWPIPDAPAADEYTAPERFGPRWRGSRKRWLGDLRRNSSPAGVLSSSLPGQGTSGSSTARAELVRREAIDGPLAVPAMPADPPRLSDLLEHREFPRTLRARSLARDPPWPTTSWTGEHGSRRSKRPSEAPRRSCARGLRRVARNVFPPASSPRRTRGEAPRDGVRSESR